MAERRIGLIPYANTIRQGPEFCALFVTDRRTIIVFAKPMETFKGALKQVYGREADQPAEAGSKIDFRTVDIDRLAAMNDNISISHSSIIKLKCGKVIGGYGLWIDFKEESGKRGAAFANLMPHPDTLKRLKAQGMKAKDIEKDYVVKCQEVFKKALPAIIAGDAEWRL